MRGAETRLKPLMIAALDGDRSAYREALRILSPYLRGYFARRLGGAAADLEDLVQETLLAIHLKRDTFDRARPFTPWAHAIARFKLMDHFRRRHVHYAAPLEEADEVWAADNPEEGAVHVDIDRLLGRLPARQRALMREVKLRGLTMEEAAYKSGMSVSAVKVSIHRGMKRMAREVTDDDR